MNKIKIISTGQIGFIDQEEEISLNSEILVDSEGIIEIATVLCNKDCPKVNDKDIKEISFIRILNDDDKNNKKDLIKKAEKYLHEARNKAFRHGLDMKILRSELSFDEKKLTFYFTAEGRIDFRSLVADMAGDFRKIIRLQQVGPRDEAKLYGGFGKCGRELCCAKFLNNLDTITLEMAEAQNIPNAKTNKLSGCCGKLMCCLSYEVGDKKNIEQKVAEKAEVDA
jgi:cell fate regulator YaaT (PSP1 superfamily)